MSQIVIISENGLEIALPKKESGKVRYSDSGHGRGDELKTGRQCRAVDEILTSKFSRSLTDVC